MGRRAPQCRADGDRHHPRRVRGGSARERGHLQATIPAALGLFGTPWLFDRSLILAGAVTTLAVLLLFLLFRGGRITGRRLSLASLLYLLFAGALSL